MTKHCCKGKPCGKTCIKKTKNCCTEPTTSIALCTIDNCPKETECKEEDGCYDGGMSKAGPTVEELTCTSK